LAREDVRHALVQAKPLAQLASRIATSEALVCRIATMSAIACCSLGFEISGWALPVLLASPKRHPNGRPPPWCRPARHRLRLASLMRSEISPRSSNEMPLSRCMSVDTRQ